MDDSKKETGDRISTLSTPATKMQIVTAEPGRKESVIPPGCPICQSSARFVFRVGDYPIHECSACRHRYVARQFDGQHTIRNYSDDYFEGGGAGYTDYLGEEQIITDHGQRYAKIVNRHTKPGRLLDIGAAAGFIMNGFAREGWTCHGVEPNSQMAALAAKSGFEVTHSGFEDVALDDQFDLISMIQVIPHFHNLKQAAEVAAGLTRPGGHWLVETWNHHSRTARALGRYWHEYSPPTVLHWFCGKSLDQLAAQFGMLPIARGRPRKFLQGQHAKSLLDHCFRKSIFTLPLTVPLRLIPDRLRIRYPSEDLTWVLYQQQS
jgi:2-polyprenyl-3-methyl-5-hydroxy-6-metoxy-1,4-benzoquinol methylase